MFLPQCQRPCFTPIQKNRQSYVYLKSLFVIRPSTPSTSDLIFRLKFLCFFSINYMRVTCTALLNLLDFVVLLFSKQDKLLSSTCSALRSSCLFLSLRSKFSAVSRL
jgi:hypothetical protein